MPGERTRDGRIERDGNLSDRSSIRYPRAKLIPSHGHRSEMAPDAALALMTLDLVAEGR